MPRRISIFVLLLSLWLASARGQGIEPAQSAGVIAAQQEMQNLETALVAAYLDIGYLVSLETLDDLSIFPTQKPYDYINNGAGTFVLRPEIGFFETNPRNLLPVWLGPYATYQPGTTQLSTMPYDQGTPLDPWNSPYYFFSPLGLIRGDTGAITQDFYADDFDRYTIVSLGPDGLMSGDDVIRQLGFSISGVTGLAISSLAGPEVTTLLSITGSAFRAPEGAQVTINGYNMGATQGASQILFGATPLSGVSAWSATAVTLQLPPGIFGTQTIKIQSGAAMSNGLQLTILANGAETWAEYE